MFRIFKLINNLDLPLFKSKSPIQVLPKASKVPASSPPPAPPAQEAQPTPPAKPDEISNTAYNKNDETNKGISGMFLHIMLKVSDLPRSTQFYTQGLGLNLLREDNQPDAGYALAFVSFGKGNSDKHFEIQLTQIYNTVFAPQGNAFGNLTIALNNVEQVCALVADNGGQVLREPGLRGNRMSAKVQDPDGYQIELIQYE